MSGLATSCFCGRASGRYLQAAGLERRPAP